MARCGLGLRLVAAPRDGVMACMCQQAGTTHPTKRMRAPHFSDVAAVRCGVVWCGLMLCHAVPACQGCGHQFSLRGATDETAVLFVCAPSALPGPTPGNHLPLRPRAPLHVCCCTRLERRYQPCPRPATTHPHSFCVWWPASVLWAVHSLSHQLRTCRQLDPMPALIPRNR